MKIEKMKVDKSLVSHKDFNQINVYTFAVSLWLDGEGAMIEVHRSGKIRQSGRAPGAYLGVDKVIVRRC